MWIYNKFLYFSSSGISVVSYCKLAIYQSDFVGRMASSLNNQGHCQFNHVSTEKVRINTALPCLIR